MPTVHYYSMLIRTINSNTVTSWTTTTPKLRSPENSNSVSN